MKQNGKQQPLNTAAISPENERLLKEIDEGLTVVYALQTELSREIRHLQNLMLRANYPVTEVVKLTGGRENEQAVAG